MWTETSEDVFDIECDECGDTFSDVHIENLLLETSLGVLHHDKNQLIIKIMRESLGYDYHRLKGPDGKKVGKSKCYCPDCIRYFKHNNEW